MPMVVLLNTRTSGREWAALVLHWNPLMMKAQILGPMVVLLEPAEARKPQEEELKCSLTVASP